MEMIQVESSNVHSIGYDESTETLHVRFLNGSLYEYGNVSIIVYQELMDAPSKGSYFNRNIRNSYPYQRIE